MEGQVKISAGRVGAALSLSCLMAANVPAQDAAAPDSGQMTLRRSAQTRDYNGQEYEGEDRLIHAGDTLWQILVKEKGLPEARFGQALVVIRGLNPQIKQLNILRVGDRIFIPLQPDVAPPVQTANAKGEEPRPAPNSVGQGKVRDYRVEAGDHLYQVLREQLGMKDYRDLVQYYALVKDLNPQRKNWDVLLEGETIRLPDLPGRGTTIAGKMDRGARPAESMVKLPEVRAAESKPVPVPTAKAVTANDPRRLPTQENMALLSRVIEALGSELQQGGEEILALKDGTVRLDRATYPVVYNPKLQQKVVLDAGEQIPASLQARLSENSGVMPVVPVSRNSSLQDSVERILTRLGYQSLPADRPVVIQHGGVAFEARGHWIALGPEQSNKAQEIFVINLRENAGDMPDYLRHELSQKGLHLKDILLGNHGGEAAPVSISVAKEVMPSVKYWPRDKSEFVDALLLTLRLRFGVGETVKTQLRDGLSVDVRLDRVFERDGKRTAIFFNRMDPVFRSALQEREKTRVVGIEIANMDHKQIATRVFSEFGDPSSYQEHRFPVGSQPEQLQVTAWGFLLDKQGMFITDRDIPPPLYRFFFEKGLEIIYF
ncbi:MAG: hypothetical protein FJ145_25580 [Deltaproteobacteria bacterium]|nr:hypothetical protein [Deltaproteobacteria bacterium]